MFGVEQHHQPIADLGHRFDETLGLIDHDLGRGSKSIRSELCHFARAVHQEPDPPARVIDDDDAIVEGRLR